MNTVHKTYAGIGSRQTPIEVMEAMYQVAEYLTQRMWVLRSGGANGADTAFEKGCDAGCGKKEIYLPWEGFNGRSGASEISMDAMELAAAFHPRWDGLSQGTKRLHARNGYQILGSNLNHPVDMVICWTPDGAGGGGTGQALRLARHLEIPIFDLGKEDAWGNLEAFINEG